MLKWSCRRADGLDAYIIFMGLLGLVVLYPAGNMAAVDAYFFGASASTESGLNTYVSRFRGWWMLRKVLG